MLNKNNLFFFLTGIVLFLIGCHASQQLGNRPLSVYQPEFSVPALLEQEGELTNLLIKLPKGNFEITVNVYESFRGKSPIFDYQEEVKLPTEKVIPIPLPIRNSIFPVAIRIIDLDNNLQFEDLLIPEDNLSASRQHLKTTTVDGAPFFDRYLNIGSALRFQSENPSIQHIYIQYTTTSYTPAPPPASSTYSFIPVSSSGPVTKHSIKEPYLFDKAGLYFIKYSQNSKNGFFLKVADAEFPKLTDIEDLILSIRYITKNAEYKELNASPNKKETLDEFWLARSSSKERARYLIKNYYNRIQQANIHFTTYKAGWKTDRGLIYTIFGAPKQVEKTGEYEYWFYEENSARPKVSFFFDRIDSQLILRRSPFLEPAWNGQISLWRQGIIP